MKPIEKLNYYELLGVTSNATVDEIKKAYYESTKEFHPDKYQSDKSINEIEKAVRLNILKEINKAYETLIDVKRREEYNEKNLSESSSEEDRYLHNNSIIDKIDKEIKELNFVDLYSLLNVSFGISKEELEKEFFEVITAYHPNLRINSNTHVQAKNVNRELYEAMVHAYDILSNEESRKNYDKRYKTIFLGNRSTEKDSKQNQKKKARYSTVKTRGFIETVKTSWKEVREDEKTEPFVSRHKAINKNYKKTKMSSMNPVISIAGLGTIHVIGETWYQFHKLRYFTEDNITKYVIRNRQTIGAVIMLGTLILMPKALGSDIAPENDPYPSAYVSNTPEDYSSDSFENIEIVAEDEPIVLNRVHTVKSGETLSEYSKNSNTQIDYIAEINEIDGYKIRAGEKIVIPYIIEPEDLKYYVSSKQYIEGMSLEDFASMNETDIDTLLILNEEAIEVKGKNTDNPKYTVLSETLTVPEFISKNEYKNIKATTESYVKTDGNN